MTVPQLKQVSTALSLRIKGIKGAKELKQTVLTAVQDLRDQGQDSLVSTWLRRAACCAPLTSAGLAGQRLALFCYMLCPTHHSPSLRPDSIAFSACLAGHRGQ